jgi:hypothetical protein
MRRLALALALVALSASTATAQTAAAQSIRVERLEGDRGDRARRALVDQLRDRGHEVVDGDASVVVEGRVSARGWTLTARHAGGEDEVRVSGRSPADLARRAVDGLAPLLVAPAPPPSVPSVLAAEPVREQVAPPPRTERPRAEPQPLGAWTEAPALMRLAVGAALFGRRLTYADDLFLRLAANHVPAAPQVTASGALFPLRALSREAFAHVGVGFELRHAFLLDSVSQDHRSVLPTRAYAWSLDLRYELPFDGHHVGAAIAYGGEVFSVELPAQGPGRIARPAIRSVDYRFVRPSLSASFRLHELVRVGGSVGWRALLATGGLDTSHGMPSSEGAGWDAELSLGLRLLYWLEARVRGGYHAYFFGFRPQLGEYYVVGGALDEWMTLGVEVEVIIPGASS